MYYGKTRCTITHCVVSIIMAINCGQVSRFQEMEAILCVYIYISILCVYIYISRKFPFAWIIQIMLPTKSAIHSKYKNCILKWMLYADIVAEYLYLKIAIS